MQNTYLTTFQLLGGFGLLLGVSGLAVVLLRGIWERRSELALLRSLGFRSRSLNRTIMIENGLLLVLGFMAGALSSVAAIAPHLASGFAIPWLRIGGMLGAALLLGFLVQGVAVALSSRNNLMPLLRKE